LSIPVSGLYLLAAPSTPSSVRGTVIDHIADGEQKFSLAQVRQMVADETEQQRAGA
jgi:hypothetical protein